MPDEEITVLVLNGIKKIKTIKINRKRVRNAVYAASLFAFLLLISISFNIYQFMRSTETPQQSRQSGITEDIQPGTKTPSPPAKENVAGTAISNPDGRPKETNMPVTQKDPRFGGDIFANDCESKIIGFQDLSDTLQLNGFELKISFSIVNYTNLYFSGKFIIIAKTTNTEKPFISYPNLELNPDGTVVSFRFGETFGMNYLTRQKVCTLLLPDKTAHFEYFRILVYSESGDLILQKTKKVGNENIRSLH